MACRRDVPDSSAARMKTSGPIRYQCPGCGREVGALDEVFICPTAGAQEAPPREERKALKRHLPEVNLRRWDRCRRGHALPADGSRCPRCKPLIMRMPR